MKTPIARVALNGKDRCCDRRPLLPSALYAHKERGQYVPDALFEPIQAGSVCSSDGARVGPAAAFMRISLATGNGTNAFIGTARGARVTTPPNALSPLSCSGLYAHKGRPSFTTPPAALRFGVLPGLPRTRSEQRNDLAGFLEFSKRAQ
ncbi:hypothetical protein [Burkholderia multivorans]|uniref:hypothetical protein n=1 Tax=Burkholderia multivorans TaxID=87883 RepID=UPI0020A0DC33|nr:hypothetical protein [Burkholderia multivorans]MCO8631337.1 hypothetical protein [Burkholderia multivorans]MCO8649043.1 hypothetical protein [Burkholderia multivorans]